MAVLFSGSPLSTETVKGATVAGHVGIDGNQAWLKRAMPMNLMNQHTTVAESVLTTTGEPARVRLTADRNIIQPDGQDLSFVTVEALDPHGRPVQNDNQEIRLAINRPGKIAAVGNADGRSDEPCQGNRCKLFNGRAAVVVRSSRKPGWIELTANPPGLSSATLAIRRNRRRNWRSS